MLPRRKPDKPRRETRWKSPAHRHWVSGFVCCVCHSTANVVPAHVRNGSQAGMGQKPDDWRCVPLCDGPKANNLGQLGCHNRQHITGEDTFWRQYEQDNEQTVEDLIDQLCLESPKAAEIRRVRQEREAA